MPATNQLQKIADLIARLAPLSGKQRGMPIQHEEWNALVDVLRGMLEIDHAQEDNAQSSLEQRFAPKAHEHLGQVTNTWLDPSLQGSVGESGGGVTSQTAIADIQQQVRALSAQLAGLTQNLDQHQKTLDQFAVNDVDRAKALGAFDTRFAGVENLRTLVTGLGSQVGGLTANVNTVLDLRKSLSDANGAPIDIAQIRQDMTALQGLAANLTGVDGTPVRLRDVQLQLKEMADAVGIGGPGGLGGRLAALSVDLEARLDKKADDRATALHTQLTTEQATRTDQLRAELHLSVANAVDGLIQTTAANLKDTETRVTQTFAAQLATAVTSAKTEVTTSTTAVLDQRFAAVDDKIAATAAKLSTDLTGSLQTSLTTTLSASIQAQVTAAEGRLTDRIATAEANNQAFQKQLTATVQDTIATSQASLNKTLSATITTEVAQAQATIQTQLDAKLTTATTTLSDTLDAKLTAGVNQRLATLNTQVTDAVSLALRTLPDQIGAVVDQRFATADVAGQVQRSASALGQQLRDEFTQAINDQQLRATAAVNGALTQLRGELTVATKAAADDAVQRASTLVGTLRAEVSQQFVKQPPPNRTTTTPVDVTRVQVGGVQPIGVHPVGPG